MHIRNHPGSEPVPEEFIKKVGREVYERELFPQTFSTEKMQMTLSGISGSYRNKLEKGFLEHAFHVYSLVSARGKLGRHSVVVTKSRATHDSATFVYGGAVKPDGFDCLSVVTALKKRKGKVPEEVTSGKAKLEQDANEIIMKAIEGKKFNETGNRSIAAGISKEIQSIIEKSQMYASCTVATLILEPDTEYADHMTNTIKQEPIVVKVHCKNEDFSVVVLISFYPLN